MNKQPHPRRNLSPAIHRGLALAAAAVMAFSAHAAAPVPVRRNNFVVELADLDAQAMREHLPLVIEMERPGWLFVALHGPERGRMRVTLTDDGATRTVLEGAGETMCHVDRPGRVRLDLDRSWRARPERLIVRRVPTLPAYFYQEHCGGRGTVDIKYAWDELDRSLLHSANTVISRARDVYEPYARRWQARGGRWLRRQGLLELREDESLDGAAFLSECLVGQVWDGVALDELHRTDVPHLDRYADGFERFMAMPEREGKTVHYWISHIDGFVPRALQSFRIATDTAAVGTQSLRTLPGDGEPSGTTRQTRIPLEPGEPYTLSAYVRTRGVVPEGAAVFLIDEGWLNLYGRLEAPEGDRDWTRLEATFVAGPSRIGLYHVIVQAPAQGDLWVDAVQLERGERATAFTMGEPNLLRNADFSDGMTDWLSGGLKHNPLREPVIRHNQFVLPEIYLVEGDTEARAQGSIRNALVGRFRAWATYPGLIENTVVGLLSYDIRPGQSMANRYPDVNHKVWIEMQVRALATAEGIEGLGGLTFWAAHYASPEMLRWMGALYRHYGIEGRTDRLNKDPYILTHLENPGFDRRLDGWETEGRVETLRWEDQPGFDLQRLRVQRPMEGTFIRTTRAPDAAPNVFGQPIRDLEPGRTYSLRLYSARPDFSERPVEADITIEGGMVRPSGAPSAQFSEDQWRHVWQLSPPHRDKHWTLHFRLFTATASEGYLRIADVEPGETYWDFIRIEPWFGPVSEKATP